MTAYVWYGKSALSWGARLLYLRLSVSVFSVKLTVTLSSLFGVVVCSPFDAYKEEDLHYNCYIWGKKKRNPSRRVSAKKYAGGLGGGSGRLYRV